MDPVRAVALAGGVARWSDLRTAGASVRGVQAAVREGRIRHSGNRYVLPGGPPDLAVAAGHASALGCVSALAHRGFPLLVSPSVPHLVSSRHRVDRRVVWHRGATCESVAVAPERALAQMTACRPLVEVLVALDAATRSGLVDPDDLRACAPSRDRAGLLWALRCTDPRAESVLESALRAHLLLAGVTGIQLQVDLDGIGRVDVLIDGWLVVEADGFEGHSSRTAYRNDRRRGVAGVVGGWVTLRFSYEDITQRGEWVAATVLAVVARHRRGRFRTS